VSLPRCVSVLLAALALAGLAGCRDESRATGGCGPVTREALDPAYLVHVLDGDAEVEYTSDPPTSGPHKPSPPAAGAVDTPLSRPVQVGILERGDVLLQYRPELAAAGRSALEALAGAHVVVAPNPDLPGPVVATAWRAKRVCDRVDVGQLREFVTGRSGQGP